MRRTPGGHPTSVLTNGTAHHMQQRGETAPHDPEGAEARVSAYFAAYAAQGGRNSALHLARHPVQGLQAFRDLSRIPVLDVRLGTGLEARLIADALPASPRGPRGLAAALALPARAEEYSQGSSKQTLRRKARVAERAGVAWSVVADPAEKRTLLELANEHERTHPLQQYRKPPPEQPAMLDVDLWLVARDATGRPLLLSVTPVDGTAALLGLFRTFEITDEASATRYLMTRILAEKLTDLGVTHLFDGVHPANLTNGLRHFQRMVGFRLTRVDQRASTPARVQRQVVVGD